MSGQVLLGDCIQVLGSLGATVDSVVTDPPYGLKFMGKGWDHGVPGVPYWTATMRVMRPGAYLVAFGGTRTFHRLTCAIEDAGFEVHDCLSWLYGSGFPKHASKLKPAWEPIVLARRPAKRATPLNIDACRVGTADTRSMASPTTLGIVNDDGWQPKPVIAGSECGRWPANVVLDEEAAAMLDEASGETGASGKASGPTLTGLSESYSRGRMNGVESTPFYGDRGGASRFFYTAKAARSERDAGLDVLPERDVQKLNPSGIARRRSEAGLGRGRNGHPTVKPLALMQWLCRLVTPPGGIVLDPFCGSGTTGCAALSEGMEFIGIDRDPEYVEIARRRLAHWGQQIAMPIIAEGA